MKFKINNKEIEFNKNTFEIIVDGKSKKPDIRTYKQMKDLYLENTDLDENAPLYLMYRDFYLSKEDETLFKKYWLRYDVTIMLNINIWKEKNKTFWHYHPKNEFWKYYEEVYQVLHWKAIYLQQNNVDTFFTNAKTNDVVLMETGYGHITINDSDDILIMANIVSNNFSSEYGEIEKKKWWRYYLVENKWQKNLNYDDKIWIYEKNMKICINDLYWDFLKNPEKFIYLN